MSSSEQNSKNAFERHFEQVANVIPGYWERERAKHSLIPDNGWAQCQDPTLAIQWNRVIGDTYAVSLYTINFPLVICIGFAICKDTNGRSEDHLGEPH